MFHYCPSCASPNIRFEREKLFRCPDCGFIYYHNIAAATGCVINTEKGIILLVRAKEPALGKLDLPGGFVNPGEGALDGLRRECLEEIGWDPGPKVSLFASFPNTYPYKDIIYRTCDLFFSLWAPDLTEGDLRLDPEEIGGVRFFKPGEICLEDLAFDSTRRAVTAFLEQK
ncbi:MAG: NUDIX domain-containing protein [Treponema sp.]|jgi:ADP-ribose pyrophosphatase YjhB (NUDIX family)|nr:NUDIX domain-containing protein [Treponema sp.]